ncbi:RING finger protein 121 [Tetranychus urticae]|nr:RING finger protein 121 [Tetranychus urticae]
MVHSHDIHKVNMSALSEEERNHILFHEKHRGHEGMHAMMLLVLIVATFSVQIGLIAWKKRSMKSYQNVSMFAMWLFPIAISIHNSWWRFVGIWASLTILTIAFIWKPLVNNKLSGSTPRMIYKWFYYLYSISSVLAVSGYIIVMCTFLGLNLMFGLKPQIPLDIGIMFLFYGIYWGVLTRDFTDFLVDILTANIGYYQSSSSLPSKQLKSSICAICGRSHDGLIDAIDSSLSYDETSESERCFTLSCGHKYHEYCIYGWCLVGKKQVCPFCREKVDTQKLFSSLPFQKPHYLYGNLLDFIRYLVAWQPLILLAVQGINYFLGLE